MFRRAALATTALLAAGCLDLDGASVTLDVRQARGTVGTEWRDQGIHREMASDCTTVDECRAALQELACKQVNTVTATQSTEVVATIAPREDGRVDVVWTYEQTLDAAQQDWRDEGLTSSVTTRPSGEGEGPFAIVIGRNDEGRPSAEIEVVRGRFDHLVLGQPAEGADVWVLRSARGTLRLSAKFQEQAPSDLSAWPAQVPGLLDSLRAEPITCVPEQKPS